jgi:hypothetical protein
MYGTSSHTSYRLNLEKGNGHLRAQSIQKCKKKRGFFPHTMPISAVIHVKRRRYLNGIM